MLSGILYGLRISLVIGVGSALIAGVVGTALGLVAAYAGGRIETLVHAAGGFAALVSRPSWSR